MQAYLFVIFGYPYKERRFFSSAFCLLLCWTVFCCSVLASGANTQVHIGILTSRSVSSVKFTVVTGQYGLWSGGEKRLTLVEKQVIGLVAEGHKIRIEGAWGKIVPSVMIRFAEKNGESRFSITHGIQQYHYAGDLLVTASNGKLRLINIIDMERYLQGVLQAETGELKHLEFFKAKAVVARTYTLRNLNRHYNQGYDLCDQTHCQVYHGLEYVNELIVEAVSATREEIITDRNDNPILAVYHSNSGGITAASEEVWALPMSYLRSKVDSFSIGGDNYTWTVRLSETQWKAYLLRKTGKPVITYETNSIPIRRKYYYCNGVAIPVREMRNELGLRSAFFSIISENGEIVFQGLGHGHGAGLSQEGAYRMALMGYDYKAIIRYYYTGVNIAKWGDNSDFVSGGDIAPE